MVLDFDLEGIPHFIRILFRIPQSMVLDFD
jgi:hypothetical protein